MAGSDKQYLTLIFDEGDDIKSNVFKAFKQKDIFQANLELAEGELKEVTLTYLQGKKFIRKDFKNVNVVAGSGFISLDDSNEKLVGPLKISFSTFSRLLSGDLIEGIAGDEFKLSFSIIPKIK